ncbi:hypothetical protein IFM89_002819 [Coptis chinensis]|uniref:DUF4283 domain-containing protein n=1 Tax=Coptis chinensis TaxID=261450 RepID=A0A835HT24_9MAGN|nr:hypothetical protein IFM89_002819 [Coptis chinensis]
MVLDSGPIFIAGRIFIVMPWSEEVESQRENISSLPIWVKLTNIPKQLWSKKGLSFIASRLGKPHCCDAATLKMQRLDFARVCVVVSSTSKYPKSLNFKLRNGKELKIGVEYTWIPPTCSHCVKFGHNTNKCPHKPVNARPQIQATITAIPPVLTSNEIPVNVTRQEVTPPQTCNATSNAPEAIENMNPATTIIGTIQVNQPQASNTTSNTPQVVQNSHPAAAVECSNRFGSLETISEILPDTTAEETTPPTENEIPFCREHGMYQLLVEEGNDVEDDISEGEAEIFGDQIQKTSISNPTDATLKPTQPPKSKNNKKYSPPIAHYKKKYVSQSQKGKDTPPSTERIVRGKPNGRGRGNQ